MLVAVGSTWRSRTSVGRRRRARHLGSGSHRRRIGHAGSGERGRRGAAAAARRPLKALRPYVHSIFLISADKESSRPRPRGSRPRHRSGRHLSRGSALPGCLHVGRRIWPALAGNSRTSCRCCRAAAPAPTPPPRLAASESTSEEGLRTLSPRPAPGPAGKCACRSATSMFAAQQVSHEDPPRKEGVCLPPTLGPRLANRRSSAGRRPVSSPHGPSQARRKRSYCPVAVAPSSGHACRSRRQIGPCDCRWEANKTGPCLGSDSPRGKQAVSL